MAEEEIGTRIKSLRESRGMTQEQLGAILGMNKSGIEGIESGRRSNIRADKIKLVCETFHEYPGFLLYGHGHDYWKALLYPSDGAVAIPESGIAGKSILLMIRSAIEDALGAEGLSLLDSVTKLNDAGQRRAMMLVGDLLKIGEYRKDPRPPLS